MVLKDCKELVMLLNSLIVDLRTHIYQVDNVGVRQKLHHILNFYRDRFDKLEIKEDDW